MSATNGPTDTDTAPGAEPRPCPPHAPSNPFQSAWDAERAAFDRARAAFETTVIHGEQELALARTPAGRAHGARVTDAFHVARAEHEAAEAALADTWDRWSRRPRLMTDAELFAFAETHAPDLNTLGSA
jgi:hypothetical protein